MKTDCPDSECLFAFYGGESVYHKYLIGLQFYNVFLFFWCANFVTALGQMTLAGAFASYYWAAVKPDDMPACPVFSALGRSLRSVCSVELLSSQKSGPIGPLIGSLPPSVVPGITRALWLLALSSCQSFRSSEFCWSTSTTS